MKITEKEVNLLRRLNFDDPQIAILQNIEFEPEQISQFQIPFFVKDKLSQKQFDFLKSLNLTREQSDLVEKLDFSEEQISSLFRFQLNNKQVVLLQRFIDLTEDQRNSFRNPDFSIQQINWIKKFIIDKRKKEASREKEFFETYAIYRDHIKHEDSLANQRLSFFISSQAFLFFPYFTVLRSYKDRGYNSYDTSLLFMICFLGWAISLTMIAPLRGFVNASTAISNEWKKTCFNLFSSIIIPQKYDYRSRNPADITTQNELISFLKIPRTGDDKTIPSIRHGSSNFWVNLGFGLTNNISIGFCIIWFFLFIIPVFGFQGCMRDENEGFTEEVKEILSNNNSESLPKLEAELNKKIYTDQEVIKLNKAVKSKDTEIEKKQSEINRLKARIKTLEHEKDSRTEELEIDK